jgi:hypothetical protein
MPDLTQHENKFLAGITQMKFDPLGFECVFLARFLIQCTLPHSDPGDVPVWTRKNGLYTLVVQSGWDVEAEKFIGYPWGSMPRLLLIWMVTEAKQKGCQRLQLGHSLAEFMRKLGLDPFRGGRGSDRQRLKEAMRRLFAARISFYQHITDGPRYGERTRDMEIAPDRELWWDTRSPDQPALWGSWIELGEKFFKAVMESSVPCDMRALKLLKRSPLALDLYVLCNWIGANLKKPEHFISWELLAEQIGGNYADTADFKRSVKATMRKVRLAHPGLDVTYPKKGGGIIIRSSVPAIPPRVAK